MLALGFDTSNYATSLAVVDASRKEVVCSLKEFLPVKQGELGLRQSDALFHHTVALPRMLAELATACDLRKIQAVGVSAKPRPQEGSYMPCFLAGVSAATAFTAARGLALCQTSHQQGHLAAAIFGAGEMAQQGRPRLFFHASGGTTELLRTDGYAITGLVGKSLDLYAGQAVDRLGVRLGFDFPAGAQVSALAESCTETVAPPKVSLKEGDCHLSGLQNQCEALLEKGKSPAYVAKFCLTAIARAAEEMLAFARQTHGPLPAIFAGGVMCSTTIRTGLAYVKDIQFAPPSLSSDNAVGVALIAAEEVGCG